MSHNEDGQRQKRPSETMQAADIWSLGCIYSEAAVWIADGYSGLIDYRRQRVAEIEKIPESKGGDGFHDGERILKSVLDTHKEIELRFRRSDNITKDIVDSMVEEMLWEEDRPGAKALWRRAEGILSRARQKLTSSTTEARSARPTSSNNNRSRTYPQLPQSPPQPPPERPLPERPRVSTSRPNSRQRQAPANVEMWRSLVRVPSRELASPLYGGEVRTSPESISELDTDVGSFTSSWQVGGGNRDSMASPITSPYTSPHTSSHFDFPRQVPTEGRRGPPQSQSQGQGQGQSHSQRSSSVQRPVRRPYRHSPMSNADLSDDGLGAPSSSQLYAEYLQEGMTADPIDSKDSSKARSAVAGNASTLDRDTRRASSAYSESTTSRSIQGNLPSSMNPDEPLPLQNSQKRSQGLSLFPTNTKSALPNLTDEIPSTKALSNHGYPAIRSDSHSNPSAANMSTNQYSTPQASESSIGNTSAGQDRPVTRSDSISNRSVSTVPTSQYTAYQSAPHLSVAAVLDWKKAHKKSKKNARVPPVRGADLLDKCNGRDHVRMCSTSSDTETNNSCRYL